MAERKVVSKYYPPDFKPDAVPGRRKKGTPQLRVRMMLPMSIRCKHCGEYLYQGKKFNSRKETAWDEDYLGLKIFRFYLKCPTCATELTFKTDPKNSGYVTEHNCTRNFEAWKAPENEVEEKVVDSDAMKQLEEKSHITKLEMETLDDLDEIRTMNARNNKVTADELLQQHYDRHLELEVLDDDDGIDEEELKEFMKPSVKRIDEKVVPTPSFGKEKKKEKIDLFALEEPVVVVSTKKARVKKKDVKSLVDYADD